MNKLNFLTAGLPIAANNKGYQTGIKILNELNLDGLELEFVHGVRIADESKFFLKEKVKNNGLILSAHAPFYINLNSKEPEKIDASVERIIETANVANEIGAYSITFHAAYYMGKTSDEVSEIVQNGITNIISKLDKNNKIWIRPETTGKMTQWGNLEEIVQLSKKFDIVLPCVDFSHLHARYNGDYNSYDDFCKILEYIGKELGDDALNNFHAHLAGIEYTAKGERKHLNLQESDMKYQELLKAFKKFDIKGIIVCESPNIETDASLLKEYWNSLN